MPTDVEPLVATEALFVAPSAIHGTGVFARRDFTPDDLIECCPVVVCLASDEELLEQTNLRGLYFHWEDDGLALALGYGSLYNHSWKSNARYEHDYDAAVIRYFAVRPISAGDEITINYTGDPDGVAPLWFDPVEPAPTSTRRPRGSRKSPRARGSR